MLHGGQREVLDAALAKKGFADEGAAAAAALDPEALATERAALAERDKERITVAANLEELIAYNLPENYFAQYVPRIRAVTANELQKVAARYIQPSRFVVVVVGDRKVIEPGVRALNLGPVRAMTVDEALGP